ncbi:MAG: peptidylprolyl isomerase [Clostridia bacterium]|nr:peptidylprolyl isomerase [Clostridia bacterium]
MSNKVLVIVIILVMVIIAGVGIGIVSIIELNKENKQHTTSTSELNNTINKNENEKNKNEEEKSMYSSGTHHATIVIKDYGTVELELYADIAPITVANFAKLVNEGFYNGLTFHRIIDGFMIQGGDPEGTGFGGSSETIKGEFKVNGVNNNISHVRGVISMARSSAYNSASSQFFIVQKDSTYLDGQYAGFGKVTDGMEVVDKICEVTPVTDNNGSVLKDNQPIIEKITMID